MPLTETEIVIVGAGASGSYLAARLSRAGKSVIVLDAGPGWQLDDLKSSQIWARRLRWGGPAVELKGENPVGVNFNAGWGLGGAALHHYAAWPRLHENDFRCQSRFGVGFDWPISYQELQPYYDAIQDRVGISGDQDQEIWRPGGKPYPLPPLPLLGQGRAIKAGFDALGMATSPIPMAILSRPYQNREACILDGWCDAGCPTGALYNPLVRDVPEAEAAGAQFLSGATVARIVSEGKKAVGVEYVDAEGERHIIRAQAIILAASVIHNPALLLNSATDEFPDGLGNAHGNVGRYFMTHGLCQTFGLFEQETTPYLGITGGELMSHEEYAKDRGGEAPFGSIQWLAGQAMKPNDLLGIAGSRVDLFGAELHDFMKEAARGLATMNGFCEELPDPENRIELSDLVDHTGSKVPRLVHKWADNTRQLMDFAREKGEQIMSAAGAGTVWSTPTAHAHLMGGTLMGDDPATSVTNSYGQLHTHNNIVVTGSGLFPTGGAVNPTFTIYALAARTADNMLENWAAYQ
ncbi:MAG: GMC family oxidoreductase [Hyphomonadaceae bacterium]|nr:GMC family oxidoreductase [Hyphomonadaceae bacterium]